MFKGVENIAMARWIPTGSKKYRRVIRIGKHVVMQIPCVKLTNSEGGPRERKALEVDFLSISLEICFD